MIILFSYSVYFQVHITNVNWFSFHNDPMRTVFKTLEGVKMSQLASSWWDIDRQKEKKKGEKRKKKEEKEED